MFFFLLFFGSLVFIVRLFDWVLVSVLLADDMKAISADMFGPQILLLMSLWWLMYVTAVLFFKAAGSCCFRGK